MTGDYSLVIGRKGTGKTAIAEFICRAESKDLGTFKRDYQSQKLSFKNFPFNELCKLSDDRFTHPNQYITIWKYVLLSFICRMIGSNPNTDPLVAKQLNHALGNNADTNLASLIKKWTISKISLSIMGNGGGLERELEADEDWTRGTEKLESIVVKYAYKSRIFIVLDELDEDFKDVVGRYKNDKYLQLITSLLKAVSEIRSLSVTHGLNIFPIIFLRDDILDLIRDNDKNKLVDITLELLWDEERVKQLLAHRIWKSSPESVPSNEFEEAWPCLFVHDSTRYGFQQKKRMPTFDFIARSTHLRPRDFIRYLQLAADHELKQKNEKIEGGTLRHVDATFSPYLKNELVDEIESVIPEIGDVLDVISHINKQKFSLDEFYKKFQEAKSYKNLRDRCRYLPQVAIPL